MLYPRRGAQASYCSQKVSMIAHENCDCTCQFCAEGFCRCVFNDEMDFYWYMRHLLLYTCTSNINHKKKFISTKVCACFKGCIPFWCILIVLLFLVVWKVIARLRSSVCSSGLAQYFIAQKEIFPHNRIL